MFEYFEKIKQNIGSFLLKRKYQEQRPKRFVPIASAKSILVLYDAETPENDLAVKKIRELLKTINPGDIHIVGYKHHGHNQEEYMTDTFNSYISRKDFNFFYQPQSQMVKDLLTTQYDLLFLLTAKRVFPLVVLAHYIPAAFKVGRNNIDDEDLDFMIDQPQEQSLETLGRNLITHINMFKAKSITMN